ncbi:MAG: hypothetical protein ACLRSW_02120 [Christensenellaceae bacterium]
MENAVKSFWESQRANAENSNSSYWYEMLFKDAPEITLFDADKACGGRSGRRSWARRTAAET